jgi:hypothetical protein
VLGHGSVSGVHVEPLVDVLEGVAAPLIREHVHERTRIVRRAFIGGQRAELNGRIEGLLRVTVGHGLVLSWLAYTLFDAAIVP